MDYFLCDVFDVPRIGALKDMLPKLLDPANNTLVYKHVYANEVVLTGLLFCNAFETLFGIPPSKLDVYEFVQGASKMTTASNNMVAHVIDHFKRETFYKYYHTALSQPSIDFYTQKISVYASHVLGPRNPQVIKEQLMDKLYKRHTRNHMPSDLKAVAAKDMTLFKFYIQYCLGGVPPKEYYSAQRKVIDKCAAGKPDDLVNPFTNSRRSEAYASCEAMSTAPINAYEYITYTVQKDHAFMRTLFMQPVVFLGAKTNMELAKATVEAVHRAVPVTKQQQVVNVFLNNAKISFAQQLEDVARCVISVYTLDDAKMMSCIPSVASHYMHVSPLERGINNECVVMPKALPSSGNIYINSGQLHATSSISLPSAINNYRVLHLCRTKQDVIECTSYDSKQKSINVMYALPYPSAQQVQQSVLFSVELFEHVLKSHINLACPFKAYAVTGGSPPQNNTLLMLDGMVKYMATRCLESFADIEFGVVGSVQDKAQRQCVLLIDNRKNVMNLVSLLVTLHNVRPSSPNGDGWVPVFIGPEAVHEYYRSALGSAAEHMKFMSNKLLDKERFNIEIYNRVLKDPATWSQLVQLGLESALLIQDDGMLVRPGVERFVLAGYDYIGAPWAKAPDNTEIEKLLGNPHAPLVGNGGLSLRNIKSMVEVCTACSTHNMMLFNNALQTLPEDVFFAWGCHKLGKHVPTADEAAAFAMEEIFNMGAIGFHKFWVYCPHHIVFEYFNRLNNE